MGNSCESKLIFDKSFSPNEVGASKSILNRLAIICSFSSTNEPLELKRHSSCKDVLAMESCLKTLNNYLEGGESADKKSICILDCGDAGTVLRFLSFRVSREIGRFLLKGSSQLMSRPHKEIKNILTQLSVHCEIQDDGIFIESFGWKNLNKCIEVDCSVSSQYISGVLLSCWDLPFELNIKNNTGLESSVSLPYWQMTMFLLQKLGLVAKSYEDKIFVKSRQKFEEKISFVEELIEIDISSCFAYAGLALVSGRFCFENFPSKSLQSDFRFLSILKEMNANIEFLNGELKIQKSKKIIGGKFNLSECPDLFPVLAVICGLAKGESILYGAEHLKYKESSRIDVTANLLKKMGCEFTEKKDGMSIIGVTENALIKNKEKMFNFDPCGDHRMIMAAMIAVYAGFKINIKNCESIKKSIGNYWEFVEQPNIFLDEK